MRSIVKLFNKHSVAIAGAKGSGKDMLEGNVIARSKRKYYISNLDYQIKRKKFIRLNLEKFAIGNRYDNFIKGQITPYVYPYPDNIDIFISDCGIYFPSQYNNELNRKYPEFPIFMALSRQLGECYVHTNAQSYKRVWDKIREQSDRFILCRGCKVLFGKIVIQRIRIYERRDTFENEIQPFRSRFTLNREKRERQFQERINYENLHGLIKPKLFIYVNKTNYNTRMFKELLENEKI